MTDDKKDTFWGKALGFVAATVSAPVGLAKGAYNAANGESFEEGFEEIVDAVCDSAKNFGDENSGFIKGGVTSTVTGVVLTIVTGGKHKG